MEYLLLTEYSGKILGPLAKYILGPILNGIFIFLDWLPWNNSANVGIAIILFTIVIYLLLLPLTIKQQKFSKLQAKMQPELSAIQEKYKGKKDQDSQMAMNQETQQVYAKYGVSPTGSCVQLLIQMPILFALYRVIYSIPAYVPMVKDSFTDLVSSLLNKGEDAQTFIEAFKTASQFKNQFANATDATVLSNTYIDVLNRATSAEWASLSEKFPDLKDLINGTMIKLDSYNNFLGMNIGYSPKDIIANAWETKSYLVILAAIMIPVLAAVTQWVNVKLTPGMSQDKKTGDSQADQMAASMKTMNTFMPLFSAFMCFSFSAGIGIYWIAGAVVRSIEQVLINKHIDKMDLDAEIKKNVEKRNARLKKAGIDSNTVMNNANRSTKTISSKVATTANINSEVKKPETNNSVTTKSTGSLQAKANLVKQYNEKNNK